ncbi:MULTISPECIES: hypothetical protein [unclassified Mycobacterium]|uniref:hypothetical protein n=1 Tax=unclassified Mycobacterium TaxID=2642494 RepID=UPI0029C9101F|nr:MULTISPECIES: hypothetical protein [unclassified Mycobacterium]
MLTLALTGCGSGTTSTPSAATDTVAVQTPVPNFEILGEGHFRQDNEPHYYVVVDSADLDNDGFKQNVKVVLQELADTHGSPNFSAFVHDDEAVANERYAYDTLRLEQTEAVRNALLAKEEQHLVAFYGGGLQVGPSPYVVQWFPGAATPSTKVGQRKGIEQWRP